MQITDYLERALDTAKDIKESACRDRPDDIRPHVCAYRGEDLVAIITLRDHMRDEILNLCGYSAFGFDADVISLVYETYVATSSRGGASFDPLFGKNPFTRERWKPGDMQDLAKNHGGIEKGWVSESLSVSAVNRAGDVAMRSQNFHYENKKLVWDEDTGIITNGGGEEEAVGHLTGLMPERLKAYMALPSGSQVAQGLCDDLDRADKDVLTAQHLTKEYPCVAMLFSEERDTVRTAKLMKAGYLIPAHNKN